MTRQQFIEKKQDLQARFNTAIALGNEIEANYCDVLSVQPLIDNLQVLCQNWEQERFEIVVVGEFSTGKSTFINALLQREILPSKVTPTTATVNFIRHLSELPNHTGEPVAKVVYKDGKEIEVPYLELPDYVTEMSKKLKVSEQIHHVDLYVESPYLENGVVLVDTPGLQALNPEHEKITKAQIKKSNASILLFNMEQPGKLTEIKFLRDLSDSIDRIFFVANRLDGVPLDQVDEVKQQLEKALRENDYQQIDEKRAVIYPVSALQALKARDTSVVTKHWEQEPADKLIKDSKFLLFEQRLESYLFEGEKTKDFLDVPFAAIEHFYAQLIEQLEQYEATLNSDENVEKLEKMHQLAKEEVELRNLQLKKKVIRLKNLFADTIRDNEKQFNEQFGGLVTSTKSVIEEVTVLEELEEIVNDELEQFNTDYQSLFDTKIRDLSEDLNSVMRKELNDFEVKMKPSSQTSNISLSVQVKQVNSKSYEDILKEVTQQFEEREQHLNEERQLLDKKIRLETELRYKREEKMMKERELQEDIRFQEMLIQSTSQTTKQHGVIKKRRFWFDKKGMVDVENDKYNELVSQKRQLATEKNKLASQQLEQQKELEVKLSQVAVGYSNRDDIREERKELREQKNMAIMERLNNQLADKDRQLQMEKRKVVRQLDTLLSNLKREYREFLRTLNALKLAEQQIETYIQQQDGLLSDAMNKAAQLAQQMTSSQQLRQDIAQQIVTVKQKVEEEQMLLVRARI